MVRAYAQGQPIADAPMALVLDVLLSRYPGYTAERLLREDYHTVEALLDVACAVNEETG